MRTFAPPFEKRATKKFIEKTDYCTRSKYREKYNLSRSVNFFVKLYMMNYHDKYKPFAVFKKELPSGND